MSIIQSLHGTIAIVLICTLLFVDEAGLPLPIAPNEVLLLAAGVLIAGGAFPLWVVASLAYLCMAAGMLAGYSWARTVGQSGLESLAGRLGATDVYTRARDRLSAAGPLQIGLARMVPGIRPYATLVSGAAEVDPRTFLVGALPALLAWEVILLAAGMLVGLPIAHYLSRFETVLVRGAILVALGAVAWLAIREEPADRRAPLAAMAPRLRASLALLTDAVIVASIVGGLFAVCSHIAGADIDAWIEIAVAAILLLVLLILGRRIQTPGEMLFDTHYWHPPRAAGERTVSSGGKRHGVAE